MRSQARTVGRKSLRDVQCVAEQRKTALLRHLPPQSAGLRLTKLVRLPACIPVLPSLSSVSRHSLPRGVPAVFAAAAVAPRDHRRGSAFTSAMNT